MAKLFRLIGLFSALFLFTFAGYSQDDVRVDLKGNQSTEEFNRDKEQCFAAAEQQVDATDHKTAKNTGAGVVGGAVLGKILGKPGAGAVVGGAAGAYRGRKKSKQDKAEVNEVYASCLREKGYDVEVVPD